MSTQKILIGALSGLAAGITIGVLTAPAKGEETREKISDSFKGMKKRFRKLTGKAVDELDDLAETFEHQIEGLGDDVRERVLQLIAASKATYNHVTHDVTAN